MELFERAVEKPPTNQPTNQPKKTVHNANLSTHTGNWLTKNLCVRWLVFLFLANTKIAKTNEQPQTNTLYHSKSFQCVLICVSSHRLQQSAIKFTSKWIASIDNDTSISSNKLIKCVEFRKKTLSKWKKKRRKRWS